MSLSHEQRFVKHGSVGVGLRFEQLGDDIMEPPDGVSGDGTDGDEE